MIGKGKSWDRGENVGMVERNSRVGGRENCDRGGKK